MRAQIRQKVERLERSGSTAIIAVGAGERDGEEVFLVNGKTRTRSELEKQEAAGREVVWLLGDYTGL